MGCGAKSFVVVVVVVDMVWYASVVVTAGEFEMNMSAAPEHVDVVVAAAVASTGLYEQATLFGEGWVVSGIERVVE